jgi:RNA polymerase sigma-70 factor (sigma-E family)
VDLPLDFDGYAREHAQQLLRFAAVLTNDNGTAEDAVQNVLIKAHAQWDRICSTDNPQAYLHRMVVNELNSWRRKWARYVPHPDTSLDRQVGDDTGRVDDRVELIAELAKLPTRQRAAVTLRFLEDRSDAEIAAILGCRETTVRGYIHRALKTLRVEMAARPVAVTPPASSTLHRKEA